MAVDFRGHPMFASTGVNAPTRFEAEIHDCELPVSLLEPVELMWVG